MVSLIRKVTILVHAVLFGVALVESVRYIESGGSIIPILWGLLMGLGLAFSLALLTEKD